MKQEHTPQIAIIMGSDSDWHTLEPAAAACAEFGVATEVRVVSAHRTPETMFRYARGAAARGLRVIIAGAGGAAHLPGMVASLTPLPVIGVPVESKSLSGLDSLLSIVQMPAGVPVATVSIGNARNAGLLAVRVLAATDPELRAQVTEFQASLRDEAREKGNAVRSQARRKVGF
jgi:5-(carboxyamino)imidazole ribonucleotide mutase